MKNCPLVKLSFIFVFFYFLSSCSDISTNEYTSTTVWGGYSKQDEQVTFKGTISTSGAFPSILFASENEKSSTRTALPEIPDDSHFYLIATPDSGTAVTNDPLTVDSSAGTFTLTLTVGKTWDIEVGIKNSSNEIILKDSFSTSITTSKPVITHTFILSPSSDGSGAIALLMTVPDSVGSAQAECSSDVWNALSEKPSVTLEGNTATLQGIDVPGGVYEVVLNFYNSNGADKILLFTTVQTINVFKNMTTDTWIASESSALISGGNFELTESIISAFGNTVFYVGDTGLKDAYGNDVVPSDTKGTGRAYAPFATLSRALAVISECCSSSNDYKIYIKGEIKGCLQIPSTLNSKMKSLTIQGTTGSDTDILDGQKKGSVLTISTSVPVTIKNLKITNGKAVNGGGINIESGGKVSIVDSSIDENTATKYGGGVYNEGILFLSGNTMIGKTGNEIATTNSFGNIANESGAGIYNKTGGKVYLGYKIDGEKSELSGGVCRNFLQNYTNSTALGGGVYNGGNLYFDTGNISYNFAYNGSGIYAYGNVEMTGGAIEGNEGSSGNDAGSGGGVYVGNGKTFTMSGNSQIKNNKNMALGAGVYLNYNGCTLVMNGGLIEGNIATKNGGAVYMHDMGAESYKHGHLQMKGGAKIPYGGQNKSNDIFMLDSNCIIEITGQLSTDSGFTAVIPKTYSSGTAVLSGTDELLASECCKFYAPKPESVTEHLFVLDDGKLGSILTFPNGIADGTQENPDDNLIYDVLKYSFIYADNLELNVPNCYETSGYAVISVDGEAPQTAEIEVSETETETIKIVDDGYHAVTVTLPYYASEPIVIEKRLYVKIKPIKLNYRNSEWGQLGTQYVCMSGFVNSWERMDIRGRVELHSSQWASSDSTIFECQGSNYNIAAEQWYNLDWDSTGRYWETTLYSKDDYVWIWFNLWRNASTGMGEHTCTGRTLAQMKKVVVARCGSNTEDNLVQWWTCWSGNRTNGSGQTAAVMVNFNVEEQD